MGFEEFRHRSADGLSLYGRVYGRLDDGAVPVVCLSGLTRNSRDFHELAEAIVAAPGRRPVVAFDYRGRGRSERAADAAAYTVPLEAGDVVTGLEHLGIGRAVFVGTSRGALIIHILALLRPDLIAGAVLNDAGPRIEAEGLKAIRAYVGRSGTFSTWNAATDYVERLNGAAFPALGRVDFERMARANFAETTNGIVADYDERLAEPLALLDLDQPLPELWEAFAALAAVPLMVVRGGNSLLFTLATAEAMRAAHPDLDLVEVPGQGHAPLLETAGLPQRIIDFADRAAGRFAVAGG